MAVSSVDSDDIEKALTVLEGIGIRDAELATRYVNWEMYVEHDPHVADGIEGLKAYIRQIPLEHHSLKVVRAFQDDSYVFTQAEGQRLGQNVFFDVFRFGGGLIVEHWGFSAKAAPPNESGHTQIDGPTEARRDQNTERNKSIVREYYETVHIAGEHGRIPQYLNEGRCIRHEPGVKDGLEAFLRDLEVLTRNRTIDEIALLLGQGNFGFIAARGTHEGTACCYIDLYRVEGEKIAEHWGFPESIPLPQERKNNNGML